ncbi:MAG: hypothetical protein K0R36_921 [Chryseobacterium sp.]|jgi:hypothetical protein|nr:hypothetical protein [Chryseobacterium sp.]
MAMDKFAKDRKNVLTQKLLNLFMSYMIGFTVFSLK